MAISNTVEVATTALWPQGDIRDPLGIWGFRLLVTGDASGDGIKVTAFAPAGLRAAYVYACYDLNFVQLTGALTAGDIKYRLLTNWPNVDQALPGVQAYSSAVFLVSGGNTGLSAPILGAQRQAVSPNQRFMLLFDPRPGALALNIVEIEYFENVNAATYSFEGYGYYWDRSILNAPGGPRHPGSS